jgi:hypothetical protein
MKRVDLSRASRRHRRALQRSARYSSLFRTSVSKRLSIQQAKAKEDAKAKDEQRKLITRVESSVRDRLRKEFPREFEASWFDKGFASDSNSPTPLTLSSFRTLLALNGFQKVVTPSGNKSRLYLAEGVVATPPLKLSFNASAIPFASGYQEFAKGMDIGNVGVFGDVHHQMRVTKRKERLFAQPLELSHLHPDDVGTPEKKPLSPMSLMSSFPEFVQEDVTAYRIAENSASRLIDASYSRYTTMIQRAIVRPMNDARYRTRVAIKSANAMQARVKKFFEKSLVERLWEEIRKPNLVDGVLDEFRTINHAGLGMIDASSNNQNSITSQSTSKTVIADAPSASPPIAKTSTEKDSQGSFKQEESIMNIEKKNEETSRGKPPVSVPPSPSSTTTSPVSESDGDDDNTEDEDDESDDELLETLVVISSRPRQDQLVSTAGNQRGTPQPTSPIDIDDDDEIVDSITLYRRMSLSTRILSLPDYYVLRHSSASSLVSVSVIVFGALPLAYRSYLFAHNYDWLVGSGPIAASVIGTITYGIVSWRWRARTSQQKTIHEALGARVGARDEAALLLLKEGAYRSVAGAILEAKEKGDSGLAATTSGLFGSSNSLIDPREWAMDFGVLQEPTASAPKAVNGLEKDSALDQLEGIHPTPQGGSKNSFGQQTQKQ